MLYHYTTKETVFKILDSERLWMVRYDCFMDDKNEGTYFFKNAECANKQVYNNLYITSFSQEANEPYLWENYANNEINIGFDPPTLFFPNYIEENKSDDSGKYMLHHDTSGIMLCDCIYLDSVDEDYKIIEKFISDKITSASTWNKDDRGNYAVNMLAAESYHHVKSTKYKPEKEFRLYTTHWKYTPFEDFVKNQRKIHINYVFDPNSVKTITVCPDCANKNILGEIQIYLDTHEKYQHVEIINLR